MKFEESDVIAGIWRERRFCLFLFCLVNFCTGALYVWSVFAGPLAAQLSAVSGEVVKTSELAPVFGLATGVTPFLMLAGGFVNDRFGPKLTIAFGGAAIAAGYALTAFAESVGMLYVGYGLCVGVGTGLVNGCTINSSVKWFPDRRGFAGGLVTACLGVGAAVLPFAARWMIDVCGIVETLLVFGACSGVVIVLSAFGTRKCPDELQAAFRPAGRAAQEVEAPSMNWLEMVRTPLFYPLFILFTSSAMMGLMLLSNISAIAQEQVGAGAGLAALGVFPSFRSPTLQVAFSRARSPTGSAAFRRWCSCWSWHWRGLVCWCLRGMAIQAFFFCRHRRDRDMFRCLHRHLSEPRR